MDLVSFFKRKDKRVSLKLRDLSSKCRIQENKKFIQHGTTTVYSHCRNVATLSLYLAKKWNWEVDEESLIRGALLHDYFLYDWHDKNHPRLHGYRHPYIAFRNASQAFALNRIEEDIIKHHMFPLTIVPPITKEGWIVCIADKMCAVYEMKQNKNKQ